MVHVEINRKREREREREGEFELLEYMIGDWCKFTPSNLHHWIIRCMMHHFIRCICVCVCVYACCVCVCVCVCEEGSIDIGERFDLLTSLITFYRV